ASAMPPPPPPNPTLVQGGAMAQGGAPPQAAVQAPSQQMVTMTREKMQRIAAAAAAHAVQQVTSHTSHATTASTTVAGNQDEDVSSYGEGGVGRDRVMERMAEQLRQLQDKVEGWPERRARGHPFSREILAAPLPNNFKEANLVYDGSSDPLRHVRTFENMAVLHGYSDSAMEQKMSTEDVTWPKTRFTGPTRPRSDTYCRFHRDYGYTTENCRHLKDEIERLIRAGHLKEFVYHDRARGKGRRRCRDDSEERSDRDEEGDDGESRGGRGKKPRRDGDKGGQGGEAPTKRGTIYMISGGPTDGDSNRARKEHARAAKRKKEEVGITARMPVISFKAEDVEGVVLPHNDALVITAEVAGFDVKRVFIDTGSSVDVMFYD
ncbi:Unknown protein, partial [Striga hermonthica]